VGGQRPQDGLLRGEDMLYGRAMEELLPEHQLG
jgi:hypothetical protein